MDFPSLRAPRISPAVFAENRRLYRGGLRVRRDGSRISAQSLPFPLKTWGALIGLSAGPRPSRAARRRGRRADGERRPASAVSAGRFPAMPDVSASAMEFSSSVPMVYILYMYRTYT